MKKQIQDQIDSVFKARDEKRIKDAQIKMEREDNAAAFLRTFVESRSAVIKPALESIAQYLREKGIDARIEEQDDRVQGDGRAEPASIAINLAPRTYASHGYPYLSIICDKQSQLVKFHESTLIEGSGGQTGPSGQAKLEELTEDLIHEKVLAVVKRVSWR